MATKSLLPGDLCVIAPRGRSVFAFEFFGSYLDDGVYRTAKTTGALLSEFQRGTGNKARGFPFLTSNGIRLAEGTAVIVVHEPVAIDHAIVRSHLSLRRGAKICEVLTPDDGRTRWVKAGLLRVVK